MNLSLRALASTVVLTGGLCLTATGTAQAISGSFTCPIVSYNPVGTVHGSVCTGGPGNATSGTVTNSNTQARHRCDRLDVDPFGSFFYQVRGTQCTPI